MVESGSKSRFGSAWQSWGGGRLWPALAELEVCIEGVELHALELLTASGFKRLTTEFRLAGAGACGRGEDVGYSSAEQRALRAAGPPRWLVGRWTLAELDARLSAPDAPALGSVVSEAGARYRRWAVESAALDLGLQQLGRSLAAVLGLEPRPLRYVVSLGLGTPPDLERLVALRAAVPGLRFKLDAGPAWSAELVEQLRRLDCVDVVDLKGCYDWIDPLPDAVQERVAAGLPEVLLEDPRLDPEDSAPAALAAHRERITWDAPIHGWQDVLARRWPPRWINVKPSRLGSLRTLFEVYERAAAVGLACYGGGQYELGVGRVQIQNLAALFHPDAANDVAPVAFHASGVPGGVLPPPLAPELRASGFH